MPNSTLAPVSSQGYNWFWPHPKPEWPNSFLNLEYFFILCVFWGGAFSVSHPHRSQSFQCIPTGRALPLHFVGIEPLFLQVRGKARIKQGRWEEAAMDLAKVSPILPRQCHLCLGGGDRTLTRHIHKSHQSVLSRIIVYSCDAIHISPRPHTDSPDGPKFWTVPECPEFCATLGHLFIVAGC